MKIDDAPARSAMALGASDARVVPPEAIPVRDEVPGLCREPRCPSYGMSPNCPPLAPGPEELRAVLARADAVLVFKRDVPAADLLGEAKTKHFRSVFHLVRELSQKAEDLGLAAHGFVAGSCWEALCGLAPCPVISETGPCRHPDLARPSMEASGVHVFELAENIGWDIQRLTSESEPAEGQTAMLAGMIALKKPEKPHAA